MNRQSGSSPLNTSCSNLGCYCFFLHGSEGVAEGRCSRLEARCSFRAWCIRVLALMASHLEPLMATSAWPRHRQKTADRSRADKTSINVHWNAQGDQWSVIRNPLLEMNQWLVLHFEGERFWGNVIHQHHVIGGLPAHLNAITVQFRYSNQAFAFLGVSP